MEAFSTLVAQYGYVAIFFLLALGIIGLPVPDEVLLTYLGFHASMGIMNFTWVFLFALAGSICGITISYYLGLKWGEPLLRKYGSKFFIKRKTIDRTNALFHKYGSYTLIICYFIPGVRHIAAYLGGISRYSFGRFTLFAYTGAIAWVLAFLGLGNRLGSNWDLVAVYVHRYTWAVCVLLLFAIILFAFIYIYKLSKRSMS